MKAQALPGIARDLGVDTLEWTAKTFRDLKGGCEVMYQDPPVLPEYVDRYEGLRTLMPFANWVSAKCYAFDSTGYEISMDYPRIIDIILASGYRRYISVEYEGAGDPMEGVRESVAMLRTLRSHFMVKD